MDTKNININIDFSKIKKSNKNTQWYRAVYFALIISVVIFGSMCVYLFFKPASSEITAIIDAEISATNVKFNEETLEMVKERQTPKETIDLSSGKNPFAPF